MVLMIRLQSHQVHLTTLQYCTCMQYTVRHKIIHIHKNEFKHSEMGPVRQNPIQRTVSLFICVCIALCTIVAHNTAQNRPDNFPSCPPQNHHCSDDVYLRERGCDCLKDKWKFSELFCAVLCTAVVHSDTLYTHNGKFL